MSKHTFDRVLVNPTFAETEMALLQARDRANRGARARLVGLPTAWAKSVSARPSGIFEANGGGVSRSYGRAADTSVLGVVWFTGPDGRKHVRILGARVAAPVSRLGLQGAEAFPVVSGRDTRFEALVYPELAVLPRIRVKDRKKVPAEVRSMVEALIANPIDAASWAALVDRCEEAAPGCPRAYFADGYVQFDLATLRASLARAIALALGSTNHATATAEA